MSVDLLALARQRFGFKSFRPGQEPAIRALVDGHDVLAVLPTGAGKSAIYQIAGGVLPGPTVVVSPLIALQQDQAQKLETPRSGGAAIVNSAVAQTAQHDTFVDLAGDQLEFVFLAPEQLARADVLEKLNAARPSLLVIDEAHCISEWGHDFRPDYMRIGAVIAALGRPRVLALTATAPPDVRKEIIARLALESPHVV
ncbi:MAG TPA: DEAD/DEAH box helicase, partial [Gammaproteobacteria bacterium]|nr:DEAD/DEAH box helicase [Gammaproteobacteria bacterium]